MNDVSIGKTAIEIMEIWHIAIIGIITGFALLIYFKKIRPSLARKDREKNGKLPPSNGVELSTRFKQTTPKGATVFSHNGVAQAKLVEVDNQLDEVFIDARKSNFTRCLVHSFYEIYVPFVPCRPSPVQGIPSFEVNAPNYDGTEYDIDPRPGHGKIFAAEMIISLGTPTSDTQIGRMIVCEGVFSDGVRNGAAHILCANNPDPRFPDDEYWYYWLTETHSIYPHPILPRIVGEPPQIRGLTSASTRKHGQPKGMMIREVK